MKKNLITKGIEVMATISRDVAVYNSDVKKAEQKFWKKHPVYKKVATAAAVALVVTNVALSLDEVGAFDNLKKKAKELKDEKKTTPATSNTNNELPIFKENEIIEFSDHRLAEMPNVLKDNFISYHVCTSVYSKRLIFIKGKGSNKVETKYLTLDDVCDNNNKYSKYFDTLYMSNNLFAVVLVPSYYGKNIDDKDFVTDLTDIKKLTIKQKINHLYDGKYTVAIISK